VTVTALMPVREFHPEYLRDAVDSLLGQTSPDWRLLAIVDGARGIEAALAERLDDPRIDVVPNEGRKLAGALNTGMRHAQSDFVGILLGDDFWEPAAVEVLLQRIEAHPEADFHHSARRVVNEDREPISDVLPARPGITLDDFGPGAPVSHLMCWRRELALSFGGMDESLNSVGPDDYDFPWSMAEHGAVFAHIPECLYVYRDHRTYFRLTTHLPRSVHIREVRRIQHKHGMSRDATERFIREARRGYLRQCIYRSRVDSWLKKRLRLRTARPWRENYR
jgi:glycosyltransferase involved in cell wall biosynthesis